MNFDLTGVIKIVPTSLEEPVVEEPVVEEYVLDESVVEEPVLEEPVVEEPVLEESVLEEPVVEEYVLDESVVEEPVLEEPVVEEPVLEESVLDESVLEEPVLEESVLEEPVVEEPVVEESVLEEPVVEEPVIEEPIVEEPIVEESVVEEPVLEESVVEESVVEESVVEEPVLEESVVEEPIVEEPIVEEPIVEESAVVEESVIEQPVLEEPIVIQQPAITIDIIEVPIPKLVFIIPYRDREPQLNFFKTHMVKILENMDSSDYKILYIHQEDKRTFNRGAMKNIGFLYVKSLYPNDYKNITLVFNDVDTMPLHQNNLQYMTNPGNVKHFYGYKFTLGGIVSITGGDFETTNGFPNYWAWGYEDNAFQKRVLRTGLKIDRSKFYPILDANIIQFNDTLERVMNRKEYDRYLDEHIYSRVNDGYPTIHNLEYTVDGDFVNVSNFKTAVEEQPQYNQVHNLKNGSTPFTGRRRGRMGMVL